MSTRLWAFFCLFILAFSACSSPAPTVGVAKDFATACDKADDGKRIALVGYLRLPQSYSGNQSMVLRMYESSDFSGKPVGVQTELGKNANQVESLPDQYAETDLKVHMTNGQVATFGTQVKVSGTVYFPIVSQDFDCALENPLVDPAP